LVTPAVNFSRQDFPALFFSQASSAGSFRELPARPAAVALDDARGGLAHECIDAVLALRGRGVRHRKEACVVTPERGATGAVAVDCIVHRVQFFLDVGKDNHKGDDTG
jgi:hypothetical protein